MKPLLARTLFRKIAKWKRTGLPDDFDVNDIATSSSADNNGLKKEEDVEYTQLRNEQLRSDYRKALCTDLAAIARIQNAADAENHIAEGYLSVLYGDLHCDGFIPAEQQFDRVRYAIRAIPWIIEEADEGCPDANYLLGRFLFDGIGITKDVDEAVYRLSLSAEADHVNAITTLGLGIPLSSAKRLEFLNAAVERGCPVAQYLLGCCNEVGGIVALNLKEAVRFYKLSAEQGYLMAEIALNRLATD